MTIKQRVIKDLLTDSSGWTQRDDRTLVRADVEVDTLTGSIKYRGLHYPVKRPDCVLKNVRKRMDKQFSVKGFGDEP